MVAIVEAEYVVLDPDEMEWRVRVAGGTVYFRDPVSLFTYRWHDEDEVVAAIESGTTDDEEWIDSHHEWDG